MDSYALLISYAECDGCQKCVTACRRAHTTLQSGLKMSSAGPFQFPSGRTEQYYVATPTDSCDRCVLYDAETDLPVCVQACPSGCIRFGSVAQLSTQMTHRKMALFTLQGRQKASNVYQPQNFVQ